MIYWGGRDSQFGLLLGGISAIGPARIGLPLLPVVGLRLLRC